MKIGRSQSASAEAVGRRVELRVRLGLLEAERIEIGCEMAAHAVGADHHQRADANRASRCMHRVRVDARRRARCAFAPDLVADLASRPAAQLPSSAETSSPFAGDRPVAALPGRALALALVASRRPSAARRSARQLGVDRAGFLPVAGVEVLDEGARCRRRGTRSRSKGFVRLLPCHGSFSRGPVGPRLSLRVASAPLAVVSRRARAFERLKICSKRQPFNTSTKRLAEARRRRARRGCPPLPSPRSCLPRRPCRPR